MTVDGTRRKASRLKRIALWTGGALGLVVVALAVAVAARENRTFASPPVDAHASRDPAIIERGRYLVSGPAHCAECHGDPSLQAQAGAEAVPLSGGKEFRLPVGVFRARNITPDAETGIGRYTDADIARMLRYGIRPDGRAVLPFMPFADLAADDLDAIISFLRAQAPVHHVVKPNEPNILGRAVMAFVIEPKGPTAPIRQTAARGPTAEYGRYLAHSVANCVGCHTRMDMRTGAPSGPAFAGGAVIDGFQTPNLTPDPRWGWIASWPEEVFVARVHVGRVRDGSPMPWEQFRRMTDDDLLAIFRYLRTVPAAPGGPDPSQTDAVVVASRR